MSETKNEIVETVAHYSDRSGKATQFCKENLEAARRNPFLQSKMRSKIREKLLSGIEIEDTVTGKTCVKKFDYPVEYIAQVMNPHNRTYNKWVIICALNYTEQKEEFDDPTQIKIVNQNQLIRKKHTSKKSNKKDAIAKRTGLTKK